MLLEKSALWVVSELFLLSAITPKFRHNRVRGISCRRYSHLIVAVWRALGLKRAISRQGFRN